MFESNFDLSICQDLTPSLSDSASSLERIGVDDDAIFTAKDTSEFQPKKSSASWAKLIRKVYEIDPLKCEQCGEVMRIIAFIMQEISIQQILSHIGEDSELPKMHPARGPFDGFYGEGAGVREYQYDQTLNWQCEPRDAFVTRKIAT